MEEYGLQRNGIRVLLTVLTAAMMAVIFFFSTEPADKSDRTSGGISMAVISVLYPDYAVFPPERQEEIYNSTQFAVRKTAHFTEYLILGVLIRLCLESWFGKRGFLFPAALASGAVYACTDELHQLLTDGRTGVWTDVLLDSCGVLAGVAAAALFRRFFGGKGRKQSCR